MNSFISEMSSAFYLIHPAFLLGLFFDPEDGEDVAPKHRLTLN
jgi:hypothetical protein